jgi:DNA-binding transcriptional ArsR family regulator
MSLLADILKEVPLSLVLREKISDLEAENAALKTEIAIVKDDLRQAKAQITEFEKQLERLAHHDVALDEAKTKILVAIAKESTVFNLGKLAASLQMEYVHFEYHLHYLLENGYVDARKPRPTSHKMWRLAQKGREYLIENNLI